MVSEIFKELISWVRSKLIGCFITILIPCTCNSFIDWLFHYNIDYNIFTDWLLHSTCCVLQWHETEQRDDPEGLSGVHPPAEEGPGPGEADGDPPETAGDEQQEAAPQNAGVCLSSPNLLQ